MRRILSGILIGFGLVALPVIASAAPAKHQAYPALNDTSPYTGYPAWAKNAWDRAADR